VNIPNFFAELKRRNVYKVAIAYAVVAWSEGIAKPSAAHRATSTRWALDDQEDDLRTSLFCHFLKKLPAAYWLKLS